MRRSEPIAGLGGVALIVAALLHWGEDMGAVQAVVLIGFGLLFLAVPVVALATSGPSKAVGTAVLASAFGWVPLLIGLVQLVFGDGGWVTPLAALVGWVGSWLSLRDESTPGATTPDVPRRPAPDVV
ncbi:hypothetical protein DVA67_003400 [Solirubrobacter sp. CPCC 204708]|uniref:SPW repeat-containing protein n=1 Tax=Solirubrobacter deserti TaxID=2282478 RepID=A0ABT4RMX8_9ACTN|nr:hypothetical protein [Solirubrobacter deserti]MBE2315005.1 hypothetical protein [Solirubrobacter deserti]MDA0139920.1 hypothetical protein [Solirubrobacter deserti]